MRAARGCCSAVPAVLGVLPPGDPLGTGFFMEWVVHFHQKKIISSLDFEKFRPTMPAFAAATHTSVPITEHRTHQHDREKAEAR